jgi:Type II secretory pathway, component PulK
MSTRAFRMRVSRFTAARRGSVIVVVLVTLLLASLMLTKFIENSAVELTLATRQADRSRLRADAYSALETVLAVMAEIKAIDENLYTPEQGWGDPYAYAGESPREGVTVEFAFTDESGKASLPNMTFEDMIKLAEALGLAESDARRFADGLFVWMKADHAPEDIEAEPSNYERETIPHEPPRRSLRSWEELRSVRVARDYVYDATGALTPFGAALRENISLYQFDSSNINALSPALGIARGWDETHFANIGSYRAGRLGRQPGAPPWFRSVSDLTSVVGANTDMRGIDAVAKLVRIDITVREGAASMLLSALVGLDRSVRLPSAVAAADSTNGNSPGGAAPRQNQSVFGRPGQNARASRGPAGFSPQQARPGGRSTTRETSGSGATSEERLDYPFVILEVIESAGPAPTSFADEAEEAPQL